MNDHSAWLAKLARLRIDTASNAPHKPLLLLVVLDLAEREAFGPDVLPLTPQLAFRFCSYWSIVAHRRKQKPDVRWPFTKLRTEGDWLPLNERGEPTGDKQCVRGAKLNAGFVAAANDAAFREQARRILIAKYFEPAERVALYTLLGMPVPSDDQIAADAKYVAEGDPRRKGRDVRFRIEVVAAYNYTCLFSAISANKFAWKRRNIPHEVRCGTRAIDSSGTNRTGDSLHPRPKGAARQRLGGALRRRNSCARPGGEAQQPALPGRFCLSIGAG